MSTLHVVNRSRIRFIFNLQLVLNLTFFKHFICKSQMTKVCLKFTS